MKLANMVDLGSAGSNTLQVQVLPIVIIIPVQKKGLSLKPSGGRKKKPSWTLVPGARRALILSGRRIKLGGINGAVA